MKASKLSLIGIVLTVTLVFVGVVSAEEYGCSPGYWKNHDSWPGRISQEWTFGVNLNGDQTQDTLLDTLKYKGGPGIDGAKRILLREYFSCNPE